jgi:sugar lactone lactonase YvrE
MLRMFFPAFVSARSFSFARRFFCLIAAGLLAATAPGAVAQSVTPVPTWVQLSPSASPSFRQYPAMTFDAATGQVLLFGGYDGSSNYLSDTWVWNGATWTQISPANVPAGREMASMVYDAGTGNVVLFGGYGPGGPANGFYNDTWTWDGSNWTQLSPSASPSAREGASIAYDSNSGAVLLFGGLDSNNNHQKDTWLWDGTTWTQASLTTKPNERYEAGIAYDAATGQTVLFGGANSDGNLNDTWTWNGTAGAWTQQSPASHPGARVSPALVYDAATSQTVLFGGHGLSDTWTWDGANWTRQSIPAPAVNASSTPVAAYNTNSSEIVLLEPAISGSTEGTWQMGPLALGSVNVCLGGATTPAPCSVTATLAFDVAANTTIGSVNILTQGASGKDFAATSPDSSSTLCAAGAYTNPAVCTVDVTFAPQFSGLRTGAVTLTDGSGNVLATAYLSGTGLAPQIAYSPATQSALGISLANPVGVVTDGNGNIFIADYLNNDVVEVPWTGSGYGPQTTVGTGLNGPSGVAVDGNGNLFIADFNDNRVIEVPWTGSGYGTQSDVATGFNGPAGVAVDGYGNLFVVDYYNNRVVEESWTGTGYGTPTTLGTGLSEPAEVAVDRNGNVFVADSANDRVVEEPWTGSGYGAQTTISTGLSRPQGVAVDANGNVFIADSQNNRVVEEPWTGSHFAQQIAVVGSDLTFPAEVAVDQRGNLYIADTNNKRVVKLDLADAPALSFATATPVGTTDATDGSLSVMITNIGNEPLLFAAGSTPSYPATFPENTGHIDLCASGDSVAVEYSCHVSLFFAPVAAGPNIGSVMLTDNALNVTNATQSVALSGTGTPGTPIITWSTPASIVYGTAISAAQENATANMPGTFSYSNAIGWKPKEGTHKIVVTFTPTDSTNYTAATASVIVTVTQATPVVSWGPVGPIAYGTALSTAQLHARANVPGTFVYTPYAGTVLSAGLQTLSVTFTPTDSSNYTTGTATVYLTVNKARAVLNWTTPDPITFGTIISATQLNATASIPGTFRYSQAVGWKPQAGTHTLAAYFTPTDATNYFTPNSVTVTLTVNQATPVITWPTPAPVAAGRKLNSAQLNAKANVPGTFVYTPSAGTVLAAGTQTLSVTFTPTNTTDYTPVTTTVNLTVN